MTADGKGGKDPPISVFVYLLDVCVNVYLLGYVLGRV